ncbi:MAG: type II toxin-antitoxin system prevent-host-death family antitoxin [Lentisphaerae bacterium]|nr:type II toxin-antitoxin system prevent-host-death family antitoxin [Lentisphaerota bacterium]
MSTLMVPKSEFKPKAFAYLRRVENGDQVCITDHGRPVADILPHRAEDDAELAELRGMLLKYERPMDPVGAEWEANA